MKHILFVGILLLCSFNIKAQHTIRLSVKNAADSSPLPGTTAIIKSLNKTVVADSLGKIVFEDIPGGSFQILLSYVGFEEMELTVKVPMSAGEIIEILLTAAEDEEDEEIIITATRTSRNIMDIPTRVETISGEELTEKGNMKPGDIRMMLNESTGIQTQQTSATSYNSSIRIQGLDGRYTQLLRDGFPLFGGFAGGLSLMQIAPLDLKQVEVIKGSTSTLYGGGAIAGLVNLVSKTPTEKRELNLLANLTSALGTDLSAFYSQRFKKTGTTIFASRNTGRAYDPADIRLTAIPKFERYTINPKLFLYGKKINGNIGLSYITEKRTGGSMEYIKNGTPGYYEQNNTNRITGQADFIYTLNATSSFQFKTSYSVFNRKITIPDYIFEGVQQASYTEINYIFRKEKSTWIAGFNLLTDHFKEQRHNTSALRDYQYNTLGFFIQNTWSPSERFSLETGLRGDYVRQYGFVVLPRISAMYKISPVLTARIGGGLGYKTPTVFNEEAERIQFQGILPINQNISNNEKSTGFNIDVNYRAHFGELGFTINQLFFYTRLDDPLVLTSVINNSFEFLNANGHIDTKGMETNLRFTYQDFKLFIGYTYADVNSNFNQVKSWFPLTAKHRLNNVLMYEIEEKLKVGVEAYYFSKQRLSDGATGKSYWICGVMAEKLWEHFSIFLNFENIFDTRQTRFDTIYTGSINNPIFRDIYAPVDGFVVNGGIKIRL